MSDYRALEHDECQALYRDVKDLIMDEFAKGANSQLKLASFMNSPIGQTHMSVKMTNAPNLNLSKAVKALSDWRRGTEIVEEKNPGNKSTSYLIDIPILVKIEKQYYNNNNNNDYVPYERNRYQDNDDITKPSNTEAMVYLMGLFACSVLIIYKSATGQAPEFLMNMV